MFKILPNYTVLASSLMAALVLTGCTNNSSKLPVLNDLAMSGTAADSYVGVSKVMSGWHTHSGNIENVKKLVIPAFNVTYKLKVEGTAVTTSMQGDQEVTTSTNVKVNMEDANIAMMQWVTDKAYALFVAELEKANYEVVPIADVAKSSAYYQVNHKNLVTSVSADDDSVTLVAEGLKLYNPNDKMDPNGSFMMGVSNINAAVDGDLVEEFGGAENGVASLSVNMTVQFGNFDLEDHRVSENIPFNPSFTVLGGETKVAITTEFKGVQMPDRVFYIPEASIAYSLNQDMGSKTNVIAGIQNVSSGEQGEEYNATINVTGFEKAGVEQIERVSKLFAKAITER